MKRIIITLLLCSNLSVFSQTQAEIDKVKAACKAYLSKNLDNPASLQIAKWGKVEKTYSTYEESKVASTIQDTLKIYDDAKFKASSIASSLRKKYNNDYKQYIKDDEYLKYRNLGMELDSLIGSLKAKNRKEKEIYKSVFNGYRVELSFRAKNRYNALVLSTWYFVLNKSYKVIAAGDAHELENERQRILQKIKDLENEYK
ncbi:hypothetical protein [Pedobacter glucosidilyticus]|uniref:hypothetical protein n=1 Tax=Pedobacter glucosidilyticus TaxID=1122941 RepID=UPI000413199E|nr:hypothetical protein [Pedobacter glucosidilyticus]